jgi:hypothetical protein
LSVSLWPRRFISQRHHVHDYEFVQTIKTQQQNENGDQFCFFLSFTTSSFRLNPQNENAW